MKRNTIPLALMGAVILLLGAYIIYDKTTVPQRNTTTNPANSNNASNDTASNNTSNTNTINNDANTSTVNVGSNDIVQLEIEFDYFNDYDVDLDYQIKRDGRVQAQYQDKQNRIYSKDQQAVQLAQEIIKTVDFKSQSESEIVNQIISILNIPSNGINQIQIEIDYYDGTQIEIDWDYQSGYKRDISSGATWDINSAATWDSYSSPTRR